LEQIVSTLDGIVMVGGGDLDPRRDGFMLHSSVKLMDERRETFDRMLIEKVAEHQLPLLGIGTGMQLLNVSQGGTLYLHIPEDLPKALPHRDTMDPNHRHGMVIEPDSLAERVYGDNDIRVNSNHHMAIDDVADGFLVTGRCPDGVIEMIESLDDDWLAIGTQFHPESPSATALDIGIFREFVRGVVAQNQKQGIHLLEVEDPVLV
jgi:putative glutamine amidotransferase